MGAARVRACRSCGTQADVFQDFCRTCGARLPRVKRWGRVNVQDPLQWIPHIIVTGAHLLITLGVIAIFLGEADVLVSCGVIVLAIFVLSFRVYRWAMRRWHPERTQPGVWRLLDSRVTVRLADPSVAAIVRRRHVNGTIDGLLEFRRRREIFARMDKAIEVSDRSWEWCGLVPAANDVHLVDLLHSGSMDVVVYLVTQERVDRGRGKIRLKRGPQVQPVSLGGGRVTLPGLEG